MGRIRGPVRKLAGISRRALWAGTGSGLLLVAVAGGDLRHLQAVDNVGTLLFLACGGVLLGRWVKRLATRRPVRDDILGRQVEKNAATAAEAHAAAAEAVALAKGCEKRVSAFGEIVARAAGAAEIPSPDTDATMPGLRALPTPRRDVANLSA